MKEVKQAKKRIEDANTKSDKLHADWDRLTDILRIRRDFTDHEQNVYPLQIFQRVCTIKPSPSRDP